MTRKDIQKGVFNLRVDNLYKNHGETLEKVPVMVPYLQIKNIIDSVCADFESRTCENCKYYQDSRRRRGKICYSEDSQIAFPKSDYGCIYFERKNAN